jgi:SAM-dependent methyltransferase
MLKKNDKAGCSYWDDNWGEADIPSLFDPSSTLLDNYVNFKLHQYFSKILDKKKKLKVLELGCANSVWPIYFQKYHDAQVSGLDYSEVGCEKSRQLLAHYNTPGDIYHADLYAPPKEMLNSFDLVVSFGVVEHFENTNACLQACAAFLKPGGKLFTLIPNMVGLIGTLQKYIDRLVYNVHVPIDKKSLAEAHQNIGVKIIECDYFLSMNLSVVNSGNFAKNKCNNMLRHILSGVSKAFWFSEKLGIKLPNNFITSPYVVAVAEKISI